MFYPKIWVILGIFLNSFFLHAQTDMASYESILERLKKLEDSSQAIKQPKVRFSGALRVSFSNTDYYNNENRGGDLDFDLFRLAVDAKKEDVILSAQIRFFQYMYAIHHGWIGYALNNKDEVHFGIVPMPFGITPYNSNNFFFSANYYLGLEDTQAAGTHYAHKSKSLDFDIGFYKNDDMGGVDGYVENRNKSYTYSITGTDLNSTTNTPATALGEHNTISSRIAYKTKGDNNFEIGLSGLYGEIESSNNTVGDRYAYALHTVINISDLNIKLQASQYDIRLDNKKEIIAVGAYAWNDTIASRTTSYTAHLAYTFHTGLSSLKSIKIYNDYSMLTNKSGDLKDTVMHVPGLSFGMGDMYLYCDYIMGKNMPFIGSNMTQNSDIYYKRFNLNVGYYF